MKCYDVAMNPVRSRGSLECDIFGGCSVWMIKYLQAITFESEAQASYF